MSRSPLWRPGHSAASIQATLRNDFPPLIPIAATAVTAQGTLTSGTNDYGSWTELVSSTTADWYGFKLVAPTTAETQYVGNANTPGIIDIGTGGAGAEVAILAGFDASGKNARDHRPMLIDAPYLFIPRGSRIAARFSSSTSSRTNQVRIGGYKPAYPGLVPAARKAFAETTITSQHGVSVAASSWVQVVAATSRPYSGLIVGWGINSNNLTTTAVAFDIGIGASGVESVIWSENGGSFNDERIMLPASTFIPVVVPAGSRIVARVSTGTMSVSVHGLA